ncbi:MAG: serine/threonine-protein kinase, partial [Bryobacteraceae bacterium]
MGEGAAATVGSTPMKLTEAEWMTLSRRLDEGLDLPEEARPEWVESLTGFDPKLKSVLRDLLEKHAGDDGGLPDSLPKFIDGGEASGGTRRERPLPATIGRYRVLGLIGEGGMGAVYEAEQEQPRRTVALKVVKPGRTGPEVLRRFEHESQSLARLQHPGIAQIHEAGIADTGFGPQPWFAMEFIRGLSLLEFAKARQLSTKQRLEILIKTCEAVHHAHMRGIIHRDLKPANILVDESGQPKIVDFGVARITDGDVPSARETRLGDLVGTLAYMSPEQVLADPLELDARSDVYTLGVLLYELLAGRLPYQVSGRLPQAMRAIREENPAPLGTIDRSYRGDLETVVAKALAKNKTQRYGSAADLAADLGRYLTNDPILARPPSASYQARKFAAKHKRLVGAVVAVFVALVAGLLATGWETIRA